MGNYTQEEQNFLVFIQALKYSTIGLKTYVDQCMDDLHGRLKRKIGSNQACSNRCNVTQWCNTCAAWKREIEKYVRRKSPRNKVLWKDIELWKLSGTDYEGAKIELCRIFVRDSRMITFDIHNILSILQNCGYFDIGEDTTRLEAFRNVRNIDFAHTDVFKMSSRRLKRVISSIIHFLQHPSLKGFQCISTTVIDIQGLLKGSKHSLAQLEVYSAFHNLQQISEIEINDFLSINHEDNNEPHRHHTFVIFSMFVAILIGMSVISLKIPWDDITNEDSVPVCKDSTYEYPFTMEVDLDFYRSQHDKLVGREWLLNELDEEMFFSKRGVLLLAEMGYGKSAIVAHLICQSDESLPGNWIYQHIVAYHLCNFYSQKTLSPGNFVKNLAGGFSKRIPGFLYTLQQNSRFQTYFENDGCVKDPESCLDVLVLKALNDIDMGNTTYIVVIDALDECIEHGNRNIFSVLWKRLRYFPKNVKFFITSRNTSDITIVQTRLVVIEKNPSDPNNMKDAQKIINSKELSPDQKKRIAELFHTTDIETALSKAVNYTKGNILLLTNALTEWLEHDVPILDSYTTFEDLFDDQLKRIFQDQHIFKTVTKIFQVLCTTMEPLYVEEILEIADLKNEEIVDVLSIIGKKLNHFVRQVNGKISLVHKTLAAYLTDDSRKTSQFYISKKEGCILFAKYLLKSVSVYKTFANLSLVDLASYAACSTDKKLKKKFLQYGKKLINEFSGAYIIHQAAAIINSYDAMSLLLDLFSSRAIDERDQGNLTASYVAAAFGNHKALEALLDRNANVNFIRLGPRFINETVEMLKFCKTFAFWEYSLLNIAAQNGHIETVLTLLQHNVNISHQTSFGSNSFILAVENGHTRLVQEMFLRFKSDWLPSLNQALYLSAKNGYLDIVDLLLYHGTEDICLSCNSSQYWTPFYQTRLQAINSRKNLKLFNYIFLDDRRFIRCETALEIAIQNGHTEVVKRLLKSSDDALRCRESGGRTPIFTAVKFKRLDIFNILLQQSISKSDRCLYRRKREQTLDFSERERKEYIENMCPYNVTLSHYIAYNWEIEMLELGLTHNLWNWTARDSDGATPVHYACCAGNSDIIDFMERNGARFYERSFNGSTPLHSAAICGQRKVLSDLLSRYPESVFDNQNRSISHYVAMSVRFHDESTIEIIDKNDKNEFQVVYLEHKLQEEALFRDMRNKTPLHYTCENGNVNLFNLYYKNIAIIAYLAIDDFSILNAAFNNTPVIYKNVVKTAVCNIYLLSTDVNCDVERSKIFVPHEYLVYLILNSTFKPRGFVRQNIETYINISLQKNSAHLLGILVHNYHLEYSQYMYKNGIASLGNLFKHPEVNPILFKFLPDMSYNCSEITSEAVLHDIVQDKKRTFWTLRLFDFDKFHIFAKSLDLCMDSKGYNFLQRSVIGGNKLAFQLLLKLGMSCLTTTRDGRNLIELLVDSAPCFEEKDKRRKVTMSTFKKTSTANKTWIENNFASDSYNAIASYLVRKTRLIRKIKLRELCNNASDSLSFTQKVAAKGLVELLIEVKNKFDQNCIDKNNLTIAMLLHFFNHFEKIPLRLKLLHKYNKINTRIYTTTALFLKVLWHFKPMFPPKYSVERKCKFRMKNFRSIRRMGLCAFSMEKESLLIMQQYLKISGVKLERNINSMIYEVKLFRNINYFNEHANDLPVFFNISDVSEYPHALFNATINLYDKISQDFRKIGCLETFYLHSNSFKMRFTPFDKTLSGYCCELISQLKQMKSIFEYLYFHAKVKTMFLLLHLYQNKLNIPFERDITFSIRDKEIGFLDIYLKSIVAMTFKKPEFHMHKRYHFLDWFKSCKNCLGDEMIRQITLSTIWDITKWRGSDKNSFFKLNLKPTFPLKDADTPLDKYNIYSEAAEVP